MCDQITTTNLIPNELIRHLNPEWIKNEEILDEAFQLRTRPPEDYISFVYSGKNSELEKMIDAAIFLRKIGRKVKNNSHFLFLNTNETLKEVNKKREIISFKSERHPKYGMYYSTDVTADILEAKAVLAIMSSLHKYQELIIQANKQVPSTNVQNTDAKSHQHNHLK